MEKSADWFAANSWENNNVDKTNDRHEDTQDWFAEHSWPANIKCVDEKEEGVSAPDDSRHPSAQDSTACLL